MKRIAIFVLFSSLIIQSSFSQSKFNFGLNVGSFRDINHAEFLSYYGNYLTINQFYSYYTGVKMKYNFNQEVQIETGINYYYKFLQINLFGGLSGNYFSGCKINSFSIPVNLSFSKQFPKLDNLSFNFFGGISESLYFQDKSKFGGFRDTIIMIKETNGIIYEQNYPDIPIISAQTGINILYETQNSGKILIGLEYSLMTGKYIENRVYDYFSSDNSPKKENEFTYNSRDSKIIFKLGYIFRERIK